MKTFLEYLNEKITKKEFEEALNNSNIIGGCEFEFYLKRKPNIVSKYFNIARNMIGVKNKFNINSKMLENEFNFPIKLTDGWKVEEDISLTKKENGVEIITPPLPVKKLIETIDIVFKGMEKHAITDSSCGFHIHMSMVNASPIDPLKLIIFTEEKKILNIFEDRASNVYCKSIKKEHVVFSAGIDKNEMSDISKGIIKTEKVNMEKYIGVRMVDLENNHVEFRYMGGVNYHKKFDEIRKLIVNYAHGVRIACDPNYKRQEYLTRAARLNQKLDNTLYTKITQSYGGIVKKNGGDKSHKKIIQMLIKPYEDKIQGTPFIEIRKSIERMSFNILTKLINLLSVYIDGKKVYYDDNDPDIKLDISPSLLHILKGK